MNKQGHTLRTIYNCSYISKKLYPTEFGHGVYEEGLNAGMRERDAFSLHFIFSGQGKFNHYDLCGGNAFFTLPGQKFTYVASSISKWEHFYIMFSGTEAETLIKPLIRKYKNQVFEFDICNDMYKHLYSFIYNAKEHNQYEFQALLYYLISTEKCDCKNDKEHYVSYAIKIIQQNCSSNITVAEIARSINISPRYLSRIFKEYTGRTVQEHIIYKKMEYAKTLLKNTDIKICDMAYYLGYDSGFSFSSAFKKRFEISPSKYKKM